MLLFFFLPTTITCSVEKNKWFLFILLTFAQTQRKRKMDVNKTSSTDSLEKRYAELAKKTAAAIAAERPPTAYNNRSPVKPSLPQLPRYEPPPPTPPPTPPPPPRRRLLNRFPQEIRMFFPGSGRMGFDTVKSSEELPPIEILREMILYETRLRLSDSVQEIMDEYHTDGSAVT